MSKDAKMPRIIFFVFFLGLVGYFAADVPAFDERVKESEKIQQIRDKAAREQTAVSRQAKRKALEKARLEEQIAQIDLPDDRSQRFTIKGLNISGNTLITTEELLENMPLIYNASDKSLVKAESDYLYDLRVINDIVLEPGRPRQVSARTIQGFTQYILSVYQDKNYAGIYVYVPADARQGERMKDDILYVEVLEAKVTEVTITSYDPNQNQTDEGYLRHSAIEEWSPVKVGQVANKKELDDFVNLLNLNPDRYLSAVVSKGKERDSLLVGYNIYEADPWHWFIQIDNSGTKERQWNPRVGVINTNLFGIDDTFTAVYQAPWDATITDNYGLYGSYDFPLMGPRLRLNVYGGHSEFDISPEAGPISFIGRGTFYGGVLRYNAFQKDGWFFDVKGTLEHTRSKVTPSIFPDFLGTDIKFWLWGVGVDLHRSTDMSNASLTFDRFESMGGGSSKSEFALARTNSDPSFAIYTASANYSRFLDIDKIQRLSGSLQWIDSDERLVPAKMTAFGGMYTVRGYDEYEFIADGGLLASAQYEFDLVKYEKSKDTTRTYTQREQQKEPSLRKLAPLVFLDYGRAKIIMPTATEKAHEEFISIGVGTILELGDNFNGAVYYGYPLTATDNTRRGKGRVSAGMIMRW